MQIAFLSEEGRVLLLERMRPMCIPCTLDEPFCPGPSLTIGKLPPLLLPSSLALWWDAVNEITQGDVNRIPGCTISNSGFTKADIAAVMALNALDSREEIGDGSYYERALFMVLLLKDGRFGLVCEGSYIDSIRSHMYVRTSVWVAPTLHDLVYFALGDKERRILSVSILPFDDYPSAENLHFSTRYKKVKPHRRQVEHGDKSYHLEIAEPQGYTLDTWLDHAITQQDIAPDQVMYTHTPSSSSGDAEIYQEFQDTWAFLTGSYTPLAYLPHLPYRDWWPPYVLDTRQGD